VQSFDRWRASLDVVPTIAALRGRGEQIVQTVLRENEHRWESLSEADRERLTVMARAVVSRLLHEPTLRLKQAVTSAEGDAGTPADDFYFHVQALRDLFGLDAAPPELDEEPRAEVTDLDARRQRRT
jgi:glutamyl-tRNA reductase